MRITESMRLSQAKLSLQRTEASVHTITEQASTGKLINRPSDGPAAYASIVRRSNQLERLTTRQDTLARARGDLEMAESALSSAGDLMVRARELAVQLADGGYDAEARTAGAQEVSLIRDQLAAIANSRGSRGYLFGGSATGTPPFDSAGNFTGNDASMNVEYADAQTMAVNVSGQSAFTSLNGGRDLLNDLNDLSLALSANDPAQVHSMIDVMATGQEQLMAARSSAGVRMDRLDTAFDVNANALVVTTTQQSKEQDIDPANTYLDLSTAQSAYERTLSVTRQILSMASALERF